MFGFQTGPVDDQAGGYIGDVFDLHKSVLAHGLTGRDQIDDSLRQTHQRRQFDRTVQFDDFNLDALGGEVAFGDMGVFGGDADIRPAGRIVVF